MPTALAEHVAHTPLADTHEHLKMEHEWVDNGGDVLVDLFGHYVPADLISAGADPQAVGRLTDPSEPDVAARFAAVREAWELIRHTGYGEAVRRVGRTFYDLDELSPEALARVNHRAAELRRPGERLRILRDLGGLDHCQVDNFCWPCLPDASGPEFFFYDLTWATFANGAFDPAALTAETGVEVRDLETLRAAMAGLFDRYGAMAVAVKTQHAYGRTLHWSERDEAEVAPLLERKLSGAALSAEEMVVLGDWCLARGVELSIAHHLPVKIHCGYYAGNDRMPVMRTRAGLLTPLLGRYLDARFVLMHGAYPYTSELVALAKHYRNVWVDACWAWGMNPYQTQRMVREHLHAAPLNKLLIFGGDTTWPTGAVAYAQQTRAWLTRTLQAEVDDGLMTEAEALKVATRVMLTNQHELFDLATKRRHAREAP